MIEPRCDNCEHWDTRATDGLTGICLEHAGADAEGVVEVRTKAGGHCPLFEASELALSECAAEAAHMSDLRREAGPCRRAA